MPQETIEETKTNTKTERFAQWLMTREERRAEKETNLEGLIKLRRLRSCTNCSGTSSLLVSITDPNVRWTSWTFTMVPLEFDHRHKVADCTLNFNRLHCQPIHVSSASAIRSSARIRRQLTQAA
jgi:hypothetical protein